VKDEKSSYYLAVMRAISSNMGRFIFAIKNA